MKFFIFISFLFISFSVYSQGTVGIGTNSPNPRAILDLKANGAQGLKLPCLATSDTSSFTNADKGMSFYDTVGKQLMLFDGSVWLKMDGSGGGGGGAASVSFTARVDSLGNVMQSSGNTFTVTRLDVGKYSVTINTPYTNITGLSVAARGVTRPTASPYCSPYHSYGCDMNDYIGLVDFNTINNVSTCAGPGAYYEDYTSISTTVTAGSSYGISVETGDEDGVRAWIDFDQDGEFANTESVFASADYTPPNTTWTGTVNIPPTAYNGSTVMRLRAGYVDIPDADTTCLSSDILTYGETEDYTVIITGGVNKPNIVFTDPLNWSYSELTGSGFNLFFYDPETGVSKDTEFTFMGQGN